MCRNKLLLGERYALSGTSKVYRLLIGQRWCFAIVLLPILFLALAPNSYANSYANNDIDSAREMFYKANAMYERSEYNKSILLYKKIIDKGWVSGPIFYNLGNCYFKEGRLGRAILNYEKARRFIPRDSDLESNYKYAKSLIKGGVGREKKNFADKLFADFTIDELAVLLSALYIAILLVVIMSLYIRLIKRYRVFLISIFVVVFITAFAAMHNKVSSLGKEAVVIKENTDVRFEPFNHATVFFTLYEGTKIKVLSSDGDWCKIKRWDNKAGWVKKEDIEVF